MGRIVVTEFVSLDGVMEGPGGDNDFARGAWSFEFDRGEDGDKFKTDETMDAEALLLGRKTYEGFAAAWPEREQGDGPEADFAKRMNSMPKYVVSTTLEDATWQNTTILTSLDDVARLKDEIEGDLLVAGSNTLVHSMLERDIVDVLRLMIFPVMLGSGKRIFPEMPDKLVFDLTEQRQYGSIVVHDYTRQGR